MQWNKLNDMEMNWKQAQDVPMPEESNIQVYHWCDPCQIKSQDKRVTGIHERTELVILTKRQYTIEVSLCEKYIDKIPMRKRFVTHTNQLHEWSWRKDNDNESELTVFKSFGLWILRRVWTAFTMRRTFSDRYLSLGLGFFRRLLSLALPLASLVLRIPDT